MTHPTKSLDIEAEASCRSCLFWTGSGPYINQCRFSAPKVMNRHLDGKIITVWPETLCNDWCGEHKEKNS